MQQALERFFLAWHAPAARTRWVLLTAGILYFSLILCPFLPILWNAVMVASHEAPEEGSRTASLLNASLTVGAGAATLASLLGWPFAGLLVGRRTRAALLGRCFVALLLFLPPYLNTIGLVSFLDLIRRFDLTGVLFPQGMGWTITILGAAFAPLVVLIGEQVLASIDRSAAESSLLAMPPAESLRRIWLRLWAGPMVGCWLVVFWLTVVEYGVPIHFQVPVLATELVSAFVGGASPGVLLRAALPLSLVGWIAGGIGLFSLSGLLTGRPRRRSNPPAALFEPDYCPVLFRVAWWTGAGAFLVATLVPLFGLVGGAASGWRGPGLWFAIPAFRFSMELALGAAFMAVLVAVPLGDFLAGKANLTTIMLLSFPLCFPPVMIGFAHAVVWSRPALVWAHGHGAGLVAAHLARILPLCLILAMLARRSVGRPPEGDAALLLGSFRLRLRLDLPVILPVFLLGLLLSLRELDVSLMTVPPGGETLPLRMFNLLHYGSGADVCQMGLLLAVLVGTGMLILRRVFPQC